MKFDEVLRRFSGFFEGEGIRYALAGGNALLAWGLQRLTHDVDFAIDGARRHEAIAYACWLCRGWTGKKCGTTLRSRGC